LRKTPIFCQKSQKIVVITSTPGTYIHVYNRQKHTCYIKLNRRWQKDTTYVHTIFIFSNLFFKIFFTLKACLELYAATLILESYIYIGLAPCVRVQCFFGQRPLVPLLLLGHPFFSNYSFWVHHLVNQHGSVSQREQLVFCYGSNSTPQGTML
jgi:hypothetical protein